MKDGSIVVGEAPFYVALRKVARLNAAAAAFACLSAAAQAVSLFAGHGSE